MKSLLALAMFAVSPLLGACSNTAGERAPNSLTRGEQSVGWILLFDGESTENFRGFRKDEFPAQGWDVTEDGSLHRTAGPSGGDIITRDQYGNFEFACEWRIAPGGNSGIIYRATEDHAYPWETGPEYQILDDDAHRDGSKPNTRAGSLYDLYPCASDVVRPAGEWNETLIVVRGPHIQHYLNGVLVVDAYIGSPEYKAAHAQSKWTGMPDFATRDRGHIALQDHGDEVWFRTIRVRPLD
jgi:hypothetical protein